jgi:hypothetical protein
MSNAAGDQIWYKDIDLLFRKDRLTEFFPTADQTLQERLNSLTRLGIYISVLLTLYHFDTNYLYIGLIVLGAVYLIDSSHPEQFTDDVDESGPCTAPTLDNPFMNPTMKDYLNVDESGKIIDRPPACDTNDPDIKKQIDDNFNNNLYRDIDDVFGKMNSQRQFYSVPSTTIPNKQDEFAKWLYKTPPTCKEDQNCLRYEDLRAKAPVMYEPLDNPVSN